VPSRSQRYLAGLVHELRGVLKETEEVELKSSNFDKQALAASASRGVEGGGATIKAERGKP